MVARGRTLAPPRLSPDGRSARPLLEEAYEHAEPTWGGGQRSFAWSPDGTSVVLCRNEAGFGRLVVVGRHGGTAGRGAGAPTLRRSLGLGPPAGGGKPPEKGGGGAGG